MVYNYGTLPISDVDDDGVAVVVVGVDDADNVLGVDDVDGVGECLCGGVPGGVFYFGDDCGSGGSDGRGSRNNKRETFNMQHVTLFSMYTGHFHGIVSSLCQKTCWGCSKGQENCYSSVR